MAKIKEFAKSFFTRRVIIVLAVVFILGFIWGWMGATIAQMKLLGL
jgi:hypothetical protein